MGDADRGLLAEFNRRVGLMFKHCYHLEVQPRTLAAQRDALLPRLVSGDWGWGRQSKEDAAHETGVYQL